METLRSGDLAYYETCAGFIPCKVIHILDLTPKEGWSFALSFGGATSFQHVTLKITSKAFRRYGWKIGELIEVTALHVVPRKSVRGNRIQAYNVKVD